MEVMDFIRQGILWECFDEISFCGNEVKFITINNEETYMRMSLLNFFSPLFSQMLGEISLSKITQDIPVVLLPSVTKTTLTKLFDVLNYGVTAAYIEIPDEEVEELKAAAQILGIRGFSELSVSLAKVSATEVFPTETLPLPLPLDYSIGGKIEIEDEMNEDSSVEIEEKNFAADLQEFSYDKEDKNDERKKLICEDMSEESSSQGSSVVVPENHHHHLHPSPEASNPSECGYSTPLASIPLPPTPEYSPPVPAKTKEEKEEFQSESETRPKSQSFTKMFEKDKRSREAAQVKKDHKVEKEKPRERKSRSSTDRRRTGTKRRRSQERVSENRNRSSRERGSSSSLRSSDGDISRGKRRVLLPRPEQDLRASEGPPISSLPELQYIYDHKYHKLCGKAHRRIDLCDMAPVHETCGRRHSYGMECSGAWMSLTRFESLAARWSTSKMIAERLDLQREDRERQDLQREDRKRRRLTPAPGGHSHNSSCCLDWNFGICHQANCKKRHRCSAETRGGEVCMGKHRAVQHRSEDRNLNSRK